MATMKLNVKSDNIEFGTNILKIKVPKQLRNKVKCGVPYIDAALGGGGFALVKMGKDPVKALDFREVAPAKMGKDFYTKIISNLPSNEDSCNEENITIHIKTDISIYIFEKLTIQFDHLHRH